jgi:hypothetical protein
MPKKLHRRLLLSAEQQGLTGERKQAYIFGTMQRIEKQMKKKKKKY